MQPETGQGIAVQASASLTETRHAMPPAFDPTAWLDALTGIGGGYALAVGGKLWLIAHDCQEAQLAPVMAQIVGKPDRLAAIRNAIERRQFGRTA